METNTNSTCLLDSKLLYDGIFNLQGDEEMKGYKRRTIRGRVFNEKVSDSFRELYGLLQEVEDKIEDGTLKEVVMCKDCVYFQPEFVEMENNERRPYTEEEIKNGKFVTMEKGINCGSRCERFRYWEENQFPVWFNENDFCSYGKLKELKNEYKSKM